MPYNSRLKKLVGTKHDKRVKLTPEQKEEIRENKECLSQRKLAKKYGVSRRTIQFILDPKKLEENKKRRAERGGSKIYYDREKHNDYMKTHRRYKQDLHLKGDI